MVETATSQVTEPAIPPHLQIAKNESKIVYAETVDTGLRCAVFVGDVLRTDEKTSKALKLGGRIFDDAKCLPGRILTRCAITPLQTGMISVHAAYVAKEERRFYKKVFTKTNHWNPATQQFENVVVGKGEFSKNLLYKEVQPSQEIGRLVQTSGIPNGVVPVTALGSVDEVMAAQMFYFPQWIEFLRGDTSVIPEKLRELRAHIQERKAEAIGRPALEAVGDAFLFSCDVYQQWGKQYVDNQTMLIKDAEKVAGGYQRYDEIAERLFYVLELTREDKLIQNFAQQRSTSDDALKMIAESQRMMAENQRSMQEFMMQVMARTEGPRVPVSPDLKQMDVAPQVPSELVISNDVDSGSPTGIVDAESAEGSTAETTDSMEAMEDAQ